MTHEAPASHGGLASRFPLAGREPRTAAQGLTRPAPTFWPGSLSSRTPPRSDPAPVGHESGYGKQTVSQQRGLTGRHRSLADCTTGVTEVMREEAAAPRAGAKGEEVGVPGA